MTDSNEDDVSFSDEIDEETIERVRSEHGDVENMKTYLPFKRQTYTELVLALVGGFFVYAFAYITIPFILGIQNEVFAGETVRAVHHRRHVAGASAFFCGLYYVLVTARAYGIPVFNFFIGLLISLVVPSIIHSGPWTPSVTTKEDIGVFSTGDFSFHPSLIVSAAVISLSFWIACSLVIIPVEIWIRLDEENLRRALEWEEKYLPFPHFSRKSIAEGFEEGVQDPTDDD